MELLTRHRGGLDAVAKALLQEESIDGAEVGRLVDEAYGRPVHTTGVKAAPHFNGNGKSGNGNGNGRAEDGTRREALPEGQPAGEPGRRAGSTGYEEARLPGKEDGGAGPYGGGPARTAENRPPSADWPPPQWPPPPGWGPPQGPAGQAPPRR